MNLWFDIIPISFQSKSLSGAEFDTRYSLNESAPNLSIISRGSTMLFFDFDIFSPSLPLTIPCVKYLSAGSSKFSKPKSLKNFV